MRKILWLLLVSWVGMAQEKRVFTADSTGKVFVVFVRDDSVGVVYQGGRSAFVADGVFAYDFSAWGLKLKGFMRYDGLKGSIAEAKADICVDGGKDSVVILPTIDPPTDLVTVAFERPKDYGNARYWIEPSGWDWVGAEKGFIRDMRGFDFAPIEANQGRNKYEYGAWNQGYVSIKGRDVWRDGGATYFLKPKGYFTDMQTNLMDFDLRFPDFVLPNGKMVVMQPTPKREIGVWNYLKKGVSYVKGRGDDKGFVFVSDGWLIDLGCPAAYGVEQSVFDRWCEAVDGDRLLRSFVANVYEPNKNVGYVMLNWEHVGHRWNVRKDKILRCLEYWKNNPHRAKMGLWTVSSVSMGRPVFQGLGLDFSEILRFGGSYEELRAKYGAYVSVDDSYAKYVEVAHVGGYMNYPIDDGLVHHYLFEMLLNKKYTDKEVLWTFWFDQELINNFDLERVRVDSNEGSYLAQVKPRVFPSVGFNVGVWSMVGGGLDCWSDPNYWTEDKRFWGWGSKDLSGNELPNKFDEVGAKFPSQPMKVVDWMMCGVWAMSVNRDIIEADGDWVWVTLPTKSYADRSVLIAYKVKGNEALVLAYDGFGAVDGEKVHEFLLNGKVVKVKTYGRFTSVVRVN